MDAQKFLGMSLKEQYYFISDFFLYMMEIVNTQTKNNKEALEHSINRLLSEKPNSDLVCNINNFSEKCKTVDFWMNEMNKWDLTSKESSLQSSINLFNNIIPGLPEVYKKADTLIKHVSPNDQHEWSLKSSFTMGGGGNIYIDTEIIKNQKVKKIQKMIISIIGLVVIVVIIYKIM